MDDRLTIPAAAKRIKRTPAALYAAASSGHLETSEVFGRLVVSLGELLRYKRETKVGRPKVNGKPKKP